MFFVSVHYYVCIYIYMHIFMYIHIQCMHTEDCISSKRSSKCHCWLSQGSEISTNLKHKPSQTLFLSLTVTLVLEETLCLSASQASYGAHWHGWEDASQQALSILTWPSVGPSLVCSDLLPSLPRLDFQHRIHLMNTDATDVFSIGRSQCWLVPFLLTPVSNFRPLWSQEALFITSDIFF